MIERCSLLLLASNSIDTADPRATDEIREIDNAIQSANHRNSFERLQHPAFRDSDISKLLLRHKPHILHISGHSRKTDGLVLEDDNSKTTKINCAQLVDLIISLDDARLRLVFFSFCYSEACATAISAKVPYAVGVKGKISAKSVTLFSRIFYKALASDRSVQGAFDNARQCLKTKGLKGSDAMVLRVHSGTSAEVPFLSSMGFLKKNVADALQSHGREISSGYFEKSVWGQHGLTLDKSYVDLECGSLTWGDITESVRKGEGFELDPFDERSAPRTDLLEATLHWLQNDRPAEFLVIQGSPGAGKSSFTIRLAVKLVEQGYQPIRVRLRDLGMGSDPIAEIAKNILKVDPAALEYALEHDQARAVLILDGWDELTLVPNQNLIDRVGTFLESIRSVVLVRWQGRVPVILTGRPTKAVTTARNMTQNTRILTIYRFSPDQLRDYLFKLDSIYRTVSNASPAIDIILRRYEDDWRLSQGVPPSDLAGTIDVIGWPLLAHVAYRLMMGCESSRQTSLIGDQTMLLRCLTEYYCIHSRNPSDEPAGTEVRSRLQPHELRSLVQETAIALTVKGKECISRDEFRREMESWLSPSDADRTVKLAEAVDPDIFLINYLFKSGGEYHGCEFIHKSLREFSFAEAVVDNLKSLAVPSNTKGRYQERDLITEARLAITSRQWLSREIWDHIERQISWEIYRESPEFDDPTVFRRCEQALGIDAWCRIRDSLVQLWHNWMLFNTKLLSPNSDSRLDELLTGVRTIDRAVADARFGAALFRLCAMLHGVLAVSMMEARGLMNYQKNMWEELGVAVTVGSHQTRLDKTPDPGLRFFSPCKGEEELEPSSLKAAMARINAHYFHLEKELPERCDLTFLVLIGASLERFSFRFCNLSYSNFSESNLSGADLTGADLSGAWLSKTNLTRANLSMAELRLVSLRKSNLEGALLKGADIGSADFREAKGLSPEQVSIARNWRSAKFDPDFFAKLQEFENTREQGPQEPSQ
jgi:hypothetical protein